MEFVDSVDELRSSSSTRGISMPNFEVLDAKVVQGSPNQQQPQQPQPQQRQTQNKWGREGPAPSPKQRLGVGHNTTTKIGQNTETLKLAKVGLAKVVKKLARVTLATRARCSKNYGADQQRLQISDLQFDKFPTSATFACWKIRFKTEVCTCSQFPTETMLWIREVEMVDSVDDLKSSSSTRGTSMPNFEMLDARIASTLNRIIHNSHFRRRVSLEEQKAQKQDRFLRGGQIAYLIYDHFRVIGANESVENYHAPK